MFETPVLFLVFNRVNTTQKVFDKLKELKPASLYIVADGPRENNKEDIVNCENVRKIVEQIDWNCNVVKQFRTNNEGANIGIPNAINWFFEQVEYGIIMEDDCLPDLTFFTYCEELLEKYKNNNQVFFISGNCRLPEKFTSNYSWSYNFLRTSGIWGWATWRRAWKLYESEINLENDYAEKLFDYFPDTSEAEMWLNNFSVTMWDYRWHFSVFKQHGLVIAPRVNLVKNIGFGEEATHTHDDTHPLSKFEACSLEFPLIHPDKIAVDEVWDKQRFESLQAILNNSKKSAGILSYFKRFFENYFLVFCLMFLP